MLTTITTESVLISFGIFTFFSAIGVGIGTVILVAYFNQRLHELEREYEAKIEEAKRNYSSEIVRLNGQIETLQDVLQKYTGANPNDFAPKVKG